MHGHEDGDNRRRLFPELQDLTPVAGDSTTRGVLPDGRDGLRCAVHIPSWGSWEGDSACGLGNTRTLESCFALMHTQGIDVDSVELVMRAVRGGHCLCGPDRGLAGDLGLQDIRNLLGEHGLASRVVRSASLEELAETLEDGVPALVAVNGAVLHGDLVPGWTGDADEVILITAVYRNSTDGRIEGFLLDDPASRGRGVFVEAEVMELAWLDAGGLQIVCETDVPPREDLASSL